jgi:hypothetical protein
MGANLASLFTQQNTEYNQIYTNAILGVTRILDAEPVFGFAGSQSMPAGASFAAVRGNMTVGVGTTLTAGFLYGVQGKLTLKGTINEALGEYNAALVGQLDFSAATAVTAVNGLGMCWLDAGASATAGSLAKVSGLIITNTVATNPLHAVIAVPLADAVYFADLNDTADSHWIVGTTATTAAGCIKLLVNGATRYLQLYSAES